MATILVSNMVMSGEVRRWLIESGPVEVDYDVSHARYRLTGPDMTYRLYQAVRRAGERPLRLGEIIELEVRDRPADSRMTATEVSERQHAYLAEQHARMRATEERARRREVSPPLMTYPSAINWFPEGSIPRRPGTYFAKDNTEEIDRKAKTALWRYLDERQREDLFCLGYFVVNGGKSKMAYKILKGTQGNVRREDSVVFCLTHGDLPMWDLMLSQKLIIQDDEPRFLKLAKRLDETPF